MKYNKFGECAIQAYKKMRKEKCSALEAWITTAEELFGVGSSSSKKGCPKNDFLGVVDVNHKKSKNADYAVEILKRLNRNPGESFEKIPKAKFWKEEMKQEISHNSQIDVVFALWSKGYI